MSAPASSFNFFLTGVLAAPQVSENQASAHAQRLLGRAVTVEEIGSQQDANFLVREQNGRCAGVLKITNPAFSATEIQAQSLAAEYLATQLADVRFPTLVPTPAPAPNDAHRRLITFLPGGSLSGFGYLHPSVVAELGRLSGRVCAALADFDHSGARRNIQWDLQHAGRVLDLLTAEVRDDHRRSVVEEVRRQMWPLVEEAAPSLPTQVIHGDITDDNVVCRTSSGRRVPDGIIDFGDLCHSWAVNELAVTLSSLLHHEDVTPLSTLVAIRSFNSARPLSQAEADVLWPLVLLRGAVLVASGHQQVAIDGATNTHALEAMEREWQILERSLSVPLFVMRAAIRETIGLNVPTQSFPDSKVPLLRLQETNAIIKTENANVTVLDLSSTSPHLDGGRWQQPNIEEALANEALNSATALVMTKMYEFRATRAAVLSRSVPTTVPTGVDIWVPADTVLMAPWAGSISTRDEIIMLHGYGLKLQLSGPGVAAGTKEAMPTKSTARNAPIGQGDPLLVLAARQRVRVTVLRDQDHEIETVPEFVTADAASAWRSVLLDPTAIIAPGQEKTLNSLESTKPSLLERRDATFAAVQGHYYRTPPQFERGWREHLLSVEGRSYLDMVNNVAVLGHGHLGLAETVSAQLRKLNTNSRFHYESLVDFSERLSATLPDALDTVFLVNSGSEANDLAIRIALATTDRRDIVAVAEAYHGWTYASDAVSTSLAENPSALSTRPEWIHAVDAPNSYRGIHRGGASVHYQREAAAAIERLAKNGRAPAAFISESYYGNAGGIPLPDGYLKTVYEAVRRHGGLAIADEVQVGYGRLGHWFWGFQQQEVVPDIVTVAKAMGNGYPLGAVITSQAVAQRYRNQGHFFSSTGGSPVSSVVGSTVLREIQDHRLQQNAVSVGEYLKARLESLMERHPLIGAVHGSGLYLGVELVRDRLTLEPATEEAAHICDRLLDLGVIVQPTGDRLCVLKVKPPLVLERSSADFFVDALDHALIFGF